MFIEKIIRWMRMYLRSNTVFTLILLQIFILSACASSEKRINSVNIISASRSYKPVIIDGRLTEDIWKNIEPVMLKNNSGTEVSDSTVMTWVKICYNDKYLYISFVCNDTDIWSNFKNHDQYLWQEEAVEVFIDTDNEINTYVEIEVSPHNVLFDAYIVDTLNIDIPIVLKYNLKDFKSVVTVEGTLNNRKDEDRKWTVEMAIPIREIITNHNGFTNKKREWRINFYRINKDINKEPMFFACFPTNGRFHKPSSFGRINFIK